MNAVLGDYELIGRLAYGGMSELFLAVWRRLGAERLVVVKRVLPHLAADPHFVRLFYEEVRLTSRLGHPNIVDILDAGEDGGAPYLVLDYVSGLSLRQTIDHVGALSVAEAVGIGVELAKALRYAHAQTPPVIHRDVSPHNVLLSKSGFVKLADFGIAKAIDGNRQTLVGGLKGKLRYMAPEQAAGKPLTPAADQFSLGLLLYEALTGRAAYGENGGDATTLTRVARGDWCQKAPNWQAVDPSLREIVARMLAADPEQRWPEMRTVQRRLQTYCARHVPDPWEDRLSRRLQPLPLPEPQSLETTDSVSASGLHASAPTRTWYLPLRQRWWWLWAWMVSAATVVGGIAAVFGFGVEH